jgi:hypothetical protein
MTAVDDEMKSVQKEVTVAYFKVKSHSLLEGAQANYRHLRLGETGLNYNPEPPDNDIKASTINTTFCKHCTRLPILLNKSAKEVTRVT